MTYKINEIPQYKEFINGECESNLLSLKKVETQKNKYSIISYHRKFLSSDEKIFNEGLLRSVILDDDNKIISFSPPKSVSFETFFNLYPNKTNVIVAEEFIEGTMINLFWDSKISEWEISTRHSVGGEVGFYTSPSLLKKTFRTMFYEAVEENHLDFNNLNKEYSYSFVLQHPENRIVLSIKKPQLYLVSAYHILNDEEIISINSSEYQSIVNHSNVKIPQVYETWENYEDLINRYAGLNTDYNIQGFLLKNIETGLRTKERNPNYEVVRKLRGNQAKLQYQYLILIKSKDVTNFLKYYQEYKKDFFLFRKLLRQFTHALYKNYISCYICKEKPLLEYSNQYRTHMYYIHEIYKNELKQLGQKINLEVVINYVNNLHPSLQMAGMNMFNV